MEGVEVVGVYEDNGRTGTTFEGRAAFDALMDEVRAGAVDCIAVKDLSRFGRNMYETSTYLERIFPFLGVRFVAVNDGLDTLQGDGGIVVPFKGLVNEMYAVETSRKVSAVKHRQMEEGEVIYGNTCYGYHVVRGEGRLDVDDATAPFVPLAFSMFLDGERLVDIAAALAEMGAPTPVDHLDAQSSAGYAGAWRDRPWSARYVAKMLDNPVYVGTLVLGNTYRSLYDGIPAHTVPEGERLASLAVHGATMVIFLSIGLVDKVQAALLQGAYTEATPAAVVYKATWPEQKTVHCTVGTLAASTRAAGITKIALIVVGDFLAAQYDRSKLYDPTFTTEYRKGAPQ